MTLNGLVFCAYLNRPQLQSSELLTLATQRLLRSETIPKFRLRNLYMLEPIILWYSSGKAGKTSKTSANNLNDLFLGLFVQYQMEKVANQSQLVFNCLHRIHMSDSSNLSAARAIYKRNLSLLAEFICKCQSRQVDLVDRRDRILYVSCRIQTAITSAAGRLLM